MLFRQTKPCNQCPFRRASVPNWLGAATAEEFIDTTLADALMPCHKSVDYENPDWKDDMVELSSKVEHCAGARIFYANMCKLSRDQYLQYMKKLGLVVPVKPSTAVFANKSEFLTHHTSKPS